MITTRMLSLLLGVALGCGSSSAESDATKAAAAAACERSRKELALAWQAHALEIASFQLDFRSSTMDLKALLGAQGKQEQVALIEAVVAVAKDAVAATSTVPDTDAARSAALAKTRALVDAREKFERMRSASYLESLQSLVTTQRELLTLAERDKDADLAKRKADVDETEGLIAKAKDGGPAAAELAAARAAADKLEALGKSTATACAPPAP